MKVSVFKQKDFKKISWKNGRGTTQEIFVKCPKDDPTNRYSYRISVADIVESGPFSLFEGYQRWIVQLSGGEIKLVHLLSDGSEQINKLSPLKPYFFSGDIATFCELVGEKGQDFNVIFDAKHVNVKVSILNNSEIGSCIQTKQAEFFLYNLARLTLPDGEVVLPSECIYISSEEQFSKSVSNHKNAGQQYFQSLLSLRASAIVVEIDFKF